MSFFGTKLPKRVFLVKNRKSKHQHWIRNIQITSLGIRFQLKLTILDFWTKFAKKDFFWSKPEKANISTEFSIFKLVYWPNFSLNWQFWFFEPNLQKSVFLVECGKSEHYHWVLNIRISLGTKFQLKLTVLNFRAEFAQKRISSWKQKQQTPPWNFAYWN